MPGLTKRPVETIQLPSESLLTVLHPERIILTFTGVKKAIDLGAYCFLRRQASVRIAYRREYGKTVDLSTFSAARARQIRRLIEYVSDEVQSSTSRSRSIADRLRNFLCFLDWVDQGDSPDPLGGTEAARVSFRAYVEFLRERIRVNAISTNTAAIYQQSTYKILSGLLDLPALNEGVRLLRGSTVARELTTPPPEDQQGRILALCSSLFTQLASFALDFNPYPFSLALPESVPITPHSLWIFPSNSKFQTPTERDQPDFLSRFNVGFDYESGKLRTRESIQAVAPGRADITTILGQVANVMQAANTDRHHYRRRRLAVVAHHAFLLLFVAHTGMNWAQIQSLPWDDKYEIAPEGQGFRAIKYRAGGKQVSFRIETGFLPSFRQYLKVRGYLLNGMPCDLLFFSYGFNLSLAPHQVQGMNKGVTDLQLVCKLLIQTFSSMRNEEAITLGYECLEESTVDGRKNLRILGRTTKLNHSNAKRAWWITSVEGARAIRLAQSLARVIYRAAEVVYDMNTTDEGSLPLFPSASYLGFSGVVPRPAHDGLACSHLDTFNMKELFARLLPRIEEADLAELEEIDPHRPWRSEARFAAGQLWSLTSHQLRRSLALYASRSGFITLPSLRRQLQHITDEMARYYSAGSAYAKNLLDAQQDHFGLEWQKAQPESQALAYLKNVILADERLFGGHGAWVETHERATGIMTLADRDKTLKRFRKGELAYQETPLGGCTSVDVCDRRPLRSIVGCLDCSRTVIKLSKLQTLIRAQKNLVSQLDPASVEGRAEKEDLEVLLGVQQKMEKQRSRIEG